MNKNDLAHYARACTDIVFKFPFGETFSRSDGPFSCFAVHEQERPGALRPRMHRHRLQVPLR
jgi:hypothetical protein